MYIDNMIEETYRHWEPKDSVFIEAPTGSGKTTFVLQCLVPKALQEKKEVLFLSNRYLLKEQVKANVAKKQMVPTDDLEWLEQIEEFDGITIVSYQKLQLLLEKKRVERYLGSRYKYVVFDEAHYIVEDALFNPKIICLLNYIKSVFAVKIFLSATITEVKEFLMQKGLLGKILWYPEEEVSEYLKRKRIDTIMGRVYGQWKRVWEYCFPRSKKNIEVKYFDEYSQIVEVMNQSKSKWLIFVSNKASVKIWADTLRIPFDIIHAEERKQEVVEEIIRQEKFEKQALITTKLLDNGVNFKDEQLQNLVIDTISETEFIQMLGRKRFQREDECIRLYIPRKSARYFSGHLQMNIKKSLEILEGGVVGDGMVSRMLEDPQVYGIIRRFCIFQAGKLQINEAGIYKLQCTARFLQRMQEAMKEDEWAFIKEQLRWIGLEDQFSEENSLTEEKKNETLREGERIFVEITDQWMDKARQKAFRERVKILMEKTDGYQKKGGRIPGKSVIEEFMRRHYPEYRLKVKKSSRKGEETLWMIKRG